ncbi:hypothetical protein OIU76_028842 [Salix suchowensis]|nr:hypothetical protein OIU76_028842 [Salix suchowensis]
MNRYSIFPLILPSFPLRYRKGVPWFFGGFAACYTAYIHIYLVAMMLGVEYLGANVGNMWSHFTVCESSLRLFTMMDGIKLFKMTHSELLIASS